MSINLNDAWWLAIRQIRDTWIGYIVSPLYFAFLGSVLATDDTALLNIVLPMMMMILLQATISARYFSLNEDNEVMRHQVFLRSLPMSFGTIITARMIGMLAAGVINVPIFFIWFWMMGDRFDSLPAYLAWCMFWLGFAFCGMGFSLVQEFTLNLKNWTLQNSVIIVVLIVVMIPAIWLLNFRPVEWTASQAHNHPLLMALAGILIGTAGLLTGMRKAVRGFRKREFAR